MNKIVLPPLPEPVYTYDEDGNRVFYEKAKLVRARDLEVAWLVLEGAARVLTEHQIPVGNSAAGEMACEWTYDALKECRDAIRALEVRHHE